MTSNNTSSVDPRLMDLYDTYKDGRIGRRDFIRQASAIAGASLSIPAWMMGNPANLAAAQANRAAQTTLDIAEWSYFWVGVERAELARGTIVNGQQMYDAGNESPAGFRRDPRLD